MKKKTFIARVTLHKGFFEIGRIYSKHLLPFVGKRVKVTVEVIQNARKNLHRSRK